MRLGLIAGLNFEIGWHADDGKHHQTLSHRRIKKGYLVLEKGIVLDRRSSIWNAEQEMESLRHCRMEASANRFLFKQ